MKDSLKVSWKIHVYFYGSGHYTKAAVVIIVAILDPSVNSTFVGYSDSHGGVTARSTAVGFSSRLHFIVDILII